jgi:MarR family transcriptional regulator, organic hydroperoxide resistance regulator
MQDLAPASASATQGEDGAATQDSLADLLDTSIAIWNHRLGERLHSVGLTFEQWRLLVLTAQYGPMNIRALSKATLVPHSTIGRWLGQMETDGLVRRRALPQDQRSVEISITPKGRRVLMRALPVARVQFESATRGFDKQELRTLTEMLLRLRQNLEN